MTRRLSLPPSLARLLTAGILVAVVAAPVAAVDGPLRLKASVTDQADVLTPAEEEELATVLGEVRRDSGVQVFAAYIDTSGADDINTWATDTAAASSLGGNDALIVVALDDRAYSMWVGPSLDTITDDEIDSILVDQLEPGLVAGDFLGAMEDAAVATGRAAGTTAPTQAPATPATRTASPTAAPGGSDSSGGGINITAILALLVVIGGAVLIARTILIRRRAAMAQTAALDQLNAEANRALLATDEALKDAANDVDFAAAQWGDDEVGPYREAIRQATDELRASFALRQKLDDAFPEKPPERDQMLREIVARCTRAHQLLDAQEQRFDDLQDLQKVAPQQLEAMPAALEALEARRQAAGATLDRLRQSYAPAAIASVDGNLTEAAKVLETATAEAARGREIVATRPADGVVALRRAQEASARAVQLVEAVERLASNLDDAARRLPGELDAASRDLAAARDAVARLGQVPATPPASPGSPPSADPAAALRAAETAFGDAQRTANARPLDPLGAVQAALAANQAADAIMAQVADAQAQVARRRQVADAAIASAQGHVTRAVDFITTRRHGVGETARTRAAEAEMRLAEARSMAAANPEGAAATANRALALADEAYRLASGEFNTWNQGGGPVAGPYAPPPGGGGEVMGAILGGLIGGMLSGGGPGRGGSGWGGSPWGGSSRGGPRGGFGARPGGSPGSFGGGGRSRGGGFGAPRGGGGGRVRGGRW
jgi:uncharacterized membrane protein YgcG